METLGTYQLTTPMTTHNSGYSIWGYGTKNGREYFIKQFLSPKFPADDKVSSPERVAKKTRQCHQFERRKIALYQALNTHSDGVTVTVDEFFRVESKYFIATRKIDALPWEVEDIAGLSIENKKYLCSIIAHGISCLHKARIVHADLKHENILFTGTAGGYVSAKIIDFDSGFLETDPPGEDEELIGDQVYFSPEACLTFMGARPELTCKMDVFSMGILFHQYLAGYLPNFNEELGCCAGEAVVNGDHVQIDENLPQELRELLTRMLDADPEKRPTSMEVYCALTARKVPQSEIDAAQPDYHAPMPEPTVREERRVATPAPSPAATSASSGATSTVSNPFFKPGNLL